MRDVMALGFLLARGFGRVGRAERDLVAGQHHLRHVRGFLAGLVLGFLGV